MLVKRKRLTVIHSSVTSLVCIFSRVFAPVGVAAIFLACDSSIIRFLTTDFHQICTQIVPIRWRRVQIIKHCEADSEHKEYRQKWEAVHPKFFHGCSIPFFVRSNEIGSLPTSSKREIEFGFDVFSG